MVKPDVKHNYYADLDLPASASIEDIRKAYRKLALQYHPDRNAGREEECVPRFQAIQAANEILSDPAVKTKYDQDRRRAGTFPAFNRAAAPTGNPYQPTSPYPPPPRRTQPGTYQRPQPSYTSAGSAGADRFSNFPKATNTPPRNGPAAERAQQWRAWQNMPTGGSANRRQYADQPPAPPPPPRSPNPQAPNAGRPRPQRQDTKMPTEEQIRAGMRHGTAGAAADGPAAEKKSAWQAFNQNNADKRGMPRERARRAAPTTPKRSGGFDPSALGSDERPAPQSTGHYGHRHRSEDLGRDAYPPPPPGPPPSGPASPMSPQAPPQRPFADSFSQNNSKTANDVPYAEGNRTSTPYSFIGARTQLSGEGLRRSASSRDTSRLKPEDSARTSRARSQSPLRRQQQASGAPTGKPNIPGMYEDSSDHTTDGSSDTSSDAPDLTQTPEEVDSTTKTGRPSTVPNNTNPFQPPPNRKMKKPTPPSSRLNGSNVSSHANTSQPDSSKSRTQSDGDKPDMQQRASSTNMYANPPLPSFKTSSSFCRKDWVTESFGSLNKRNKQREVKIPSWAIPSSVLPAAPPQELNRGPHTSSECTDVSREEMQSLREDPLWEKAPGDIRKAYCVFRAALKDSRESVEDLARLNIELFLRLLVRLFLGEPIGHPRWRRVLQDVAAQFASLNDAGDLLVLANSSSSPNSFNIPDAHVSNPFRSTPGKARSVESFDTQFSPEGFNGTFQGNPEYFSGAGRRPSPARRNPSSRGTRVAASDGAPTNTPGDMGPPPRPDGTPKPVKYSEEEWKKAFKDASWTWVPENKPAAKSASKTPSRQNSRLHSQTAQSDLPKDGSKENPHIVEDDGDALHMFSWGKREDQSGPAPDEGDAMDIDTPPHTTRATTATVGSTSVKNESVPYSVPKSARREEQEKQHQHEPSSPQKAPDDTNLKTNLDDFSHVEPFAKNTEGLRNFADMSSTLPFSSEAAKGHPTKSSEPEKLVTPPVPKAPDVPSRLTKTTWHNYATNFGTYLLRFHEFNQVMLVHFAARQTLTEALLQKGTNWLEASGDTSDELGFGNYLKGVRQDEKVREAWNIGCENHLESVKDFDRLRERVRKLAVGGALADT